MQRLFVDTALAPDSLIQATPNQAHYLGTVMRRSIGDSVALFNGRDGEWAARIEAIGRGKASFRCQTQTRPQSAETDLWLVFALLKRDTTDLLVEKATELGASAILPTITERTNAARVNQARLHAIAVEAAEQCERLTVPSIEPPRKLHEILSTWPVDRPLFVGAERQDAPRLRPHSGPVGLLIGPEGGFGPLDQATLRRHAFIRPISLGPRILRAETAAIAGMVLLQAPDCG